MKRGILKGKFWELTLMKIEDDEGGLWEESGERERV